jgi:hypothetical protein
MEEVKTLAVLWSRHRVIFIPLVKERHHTNVVAMKELRLINRHRHAFVHQIKRHPTEEVIKILAVL